MLRALRFPPDHIVVLAYNVVNQKEQLTLAQETKTAGHNQGSFHSLDALHRLKQKRFDA